MSEPTVYVNVFINRGALEADNTVHTCVREAAQVAEDYSDSYQYTLTDTGKVDLTSEFSDEWHQQRAHDAAMDAKIDEWRESRSSREVA